MRDTPPLHDSINSPPPHIHAHSRETTPNTAISTNNGDQTCQTNAHSSAKVPTPMVDKGKSKLPSEDNDANAKDNAAFPKSTESGSSNFHRSDDEDTSHNINKPEGSAMEALTDLIRKLRHAPESTATAMSSLRSALPSIGHAHRRDHFGAHNNEHAHDQHPTAPLAPKEEVPSQSPSPEPIPATPPRTQANSNHQSVPLPIGAERELGWIGKSPKSPSYLSQSHRWSHDLASSDWNRAVGSAPGPSYTQGESYNTSTNGNRYSWGESTAKAESKTNQLQYRLTGDRPTFARPNQDNTYNTWRIPSHRFDPFNDELGLTGMNRTTSRAIPIVNPNSSSSETRHHQSTSSQEYAFSDLVISPGFGGNQAILTQRRQSSQSHDSPIDSLHYSFSAFDVPRHVTPSNSAWDRNVAVQSSRRSSAPSVGPAAQTRSMTRAFSPSRDVARNMGQSSRYLQEEELALYRNGNGNGHTHQIHRYPTPGVEDNVINVRPNGRRQSLQMTQYNPTGLLPVTWPRTDFHVQTGPVPFAPGDWHCTMPMCGYHNFNRNSECRACGNSRPSEVMPLPNSPPLGSIGDWRCECGFINWRRRALCKNCFPDHPSNQDDRGREHDGDRFQEIDSPVYRPRRVPHTITPGEVEGHFATAEGNHLTYNRNFEHAPGGYAQGSNGSTYMYNNPIRSSSASAHHQQQNNHQVTEWNRNQTRVSGQW